MAELERLKASFLASDGEPEAYGVASRIIKAMIEQQAEIEKLRVQLAAHTESRRCHDPRTNTRMR